MSLFNKKSFVVGLTFMVESMAAAHTSSTIDGRWRMSGLQCIEATSGQFYPAEEKLHVGRDAVVMDIDGDSAKVRELIDGYVSVKETSFKLNQYKWGSPHALLSSEKDIVASLVKLSRPSTLDVYTRDFKEIGICKPGDVLEITFVLAEDWGQYPRH